MKFNIVPTQDRLPEEGVVVMTVAPSGSPAELMRSGSLWLFPDGSMYVYYTPIAWIEESE